MTTPANDFCPACMMLRNAWRRITGRRVKALDAMTDLELGRFSRQVLRFLVRRSEDDNIKQSSAISGALFLVHNAIDSNASNLTATMRDVTISGKAAGDWEIIVRRIGDEEGDVLSAGDVELAGRLKPGAVDAAIACFDSLKRFAVKTGDV